MWVEHRDFDIAFVETWSLDKYWINQEVLFNFNADLTGSGSLPICVWTWYLYKILAKRTLPPPVWAHQIGLDWSCLSSVLHLTAWTRNIFANGNRIIPVFHSTHYALLPHCPNCNHIWHFTVTSLHPVYDEVLNLFYRYAFSAKCHKVIHPLSDLEDTFQMIISGVVHRDIVLVLNIVCPDSCLEVRRKIIRTVLCCIVYDSCTQS